MGSRGWKRRPGAVSSGKADGRGDFRPDEPKGDTVKIAIPMALAICLAHPGHADVTVGSKNRAALFANQTRLLDGRASEQYAFSTRLRPNGPEIATAVPAYAGGRSSQYYGAARSAARKHGIPEDLFLRLVQQESGWNSGAVSHKGAIGLAQLMPATARGLNVDPHDPQQNLDGGARYLRRQYDAFRDWRLALAAYNAGPEAVNRHGGVPPYRETQNYVVAILGR